MIEIEWLIVAIVAIVVFAFALVIVFKSHKQSMSILRKHYEAREEKLNDLFNGAVERYVDAEEKLKKIGLIASEEN